MVLSFLIVLSLFLMIGLSSVFKSRGTKSDYYIASSSVPAPLVGLSAVATNNSGYMFIGVIGYTYATGLAAIWLMIGWIAGDYLASTFIHARLRKATESTKEVSYSGVLSNWDGVIDLRLQRTAGLISLVFLLAYASAQLVAGSKALHVLLDWPTWSGAVVGAILVILYCIAGGIRASIWTDAAQSVVMITAMGIMLVVAAMSFGGLGGAVAEMREIEGFLNWFPQDLALPGLLGGLLFALSWGFAGMSVVGQPHVMVRFMTLDDSGQMKRARMWYYIWFTAFYCMATAVGMLSRIYITDPGNFDAELALPTMAQQLLPPFGAGVVLAGIFAATLSTADSLVLSCSSAVTHDLLPHNIEKPWLLKAGTALITLTALAWALLNKQSVFSLVIMSWSGLASAFAPLLVARCIGMRPPPTVSFAAMLIGLGVALGWRLMGWHEAVYEGMPGILVGFAVILIGSLLSAKGGKAKSSIHL
ncbi:MAG: sodium/proline symporter [Opitutales bacterium]